MIFQAYQVTFELDFEDSQGVDDLTQEEHGLKHCR